MRYMIIVKATRASEAGQKPPAEGGAAQIEVRRLYELEDFEPNPGLEIFKRIPGNGK